MRVRASQTAFAALAAVLAAAGAVLAGCGTGTGATAGAGGGAERVRVVATTTQVADFVRNVGGDRVELTQLLRPNVDPHDYEASPADVAAIAGADLVVQNGVGLEHFLDGAVASAGFGGTVVDTSAGVPLRGGDDPHIWQDPANAARMVQTITAALAARAPADAPAFRANAAAYTAKLTALDRWIASEWAAIPAAQRKLVTNHDAFGYYIQRYGLSFVGSIIPSFDSSAELSGKDISELVARIRSAGVRAVFSESSLPPRTAETVGREAGVRVVAGEDALYGDTLGPADSDAGTYLAMMRHNTRTIVDALRG